eukprot:snap_masked-scaffold_2-processed-gene-27.49-mRNA-1 protein AED:1.00 eAED:1.00 QI:0/0/0/0/1/1/2/0/110
MSNFFNDTEYEYSDATIVDRDIFDWDLFWFRAMAIIFGVMWPTWGILYCFKFYTPPLWLTDRFDILKRWICCISSMSEKELQELRAENGLEPSKLKSKALLFCYFLPGRV